MKKRKVLAFILSVALMAQPVVYASAQQIGETSESVSVEESAEVIESTEEQLLESSETESVVEAAESVTVSETEITADDGVETQTGTQEPETIAVDNAEVPENMAVGGYIPSELDYNTPVYDGNQGISTYEAIPSVYPSNGLAGIRNTYPAVRNQNPYGTCWAFSSLGLAEFDLINKGKVSNAVDLSELQLAYFTYNFVQDPLGGTAGDTAQFYNENYSNGTYLDYGGNYEMAMRRLGQWISPTDEANVPYTSAKNVLTSGLDDAYAYDENAPHLENVYLINIRQNADVVKEQIMQHGAVGTMYTHLYAGQTFGADYNAYYDTENTVKVGGGHAVMIVGWDDNFSKDNFSSGEKPESDGAWLIRNSWGEGEYNFDYFWMSYETNSLADTAYVFDFSADDGYDNNYQLDGGLLTYSKGSDTGEYTAANVFSVSDKTGVKSESLEAVSLSFTKSANVSYTIDIYTDLKSSQPNYGTHHPEATTTGTTTYAGVYTIPLAQAVELEPGTKYSVVVTINQGAMIDCEEALSYKEDPNANDDKYIWKCTVSQADQQSLYKLEGSASFSYNWNNFRIKAFTSNNPYVINYELNGGTNHPDNPTACGSEIIKLQNPAREGCVFEGWYLDSKYQTAITEIPADAAQDYTLYAKWASATGESVYGYSLTLDGTTGINFYMDLPDEVLKASNAYMEFTLPNGDVKKVNVADAKQKDGHYVFSCGAAAKEMASDVTAKMVVDGKSGKVYTYSIREYAEYVINHPNNYDEIMIALAKAMLNYGTSAQQLFKYNLDDLANKNLSDEDKVLTDVDFSSYQYTLSNGSSVSGLHYYGSSLLLESDTSVRDYFTIADGHSIEEYQFKLARGTESGKVMQPVAKVIGGKTYYYIEAANIKAQNLNQDIVVEVRTADNASGTAMELHYSPFSYADAIARQDTPDVNTVTVTKALYHYWEKARAYVDSNTKK